jgi:alpha-beta hydrolase superfamily lysophospholipase
VSSYEPRHESFTAADGHLLNVHVWNAQPAPRVRVVFLHGISSHAGWYTAGAAHLASESVEAHFLDRRGSGIDQVNRGDVDHWETWIEDVAIYLRRLMDVHPAPASLCGISWGGKLAAAVARHHPELVGALGLLCPGLYSPFEPGPVKRLVLRVPVPRFIQRRRLHIPLRDPALFTDNPARRAFIAEDRLTLREITWRFAREDRALTTYARQAAPFLTLPLLLMIAGRDRIIDNRRVLDFYGRAASRNKRLVEYPNAAHTLEFESDPRPYFADLSAWFCAQKSGFRTR